MSGGYVLYSIPAAVIKHILKNGHKNKATALARLFARDVFAMSSKYNNLLDELKIIVPKCITRNNKFDLHLFEAYLFSDDGIKYWVKDQSKIPKGDKYKFGIFVDNYAKSKFLELDKLTLSIFKHMNFMQEWGNENLYDFLKQLQSIAKLYTIDYSSYPSKKIYEARTKFEKDYNIILDKTKEFVLLDLSKIKVGSDKIKFNKQLLTIKDKNNISKFTYQLLKNCLDNNEELIIYAYTG